MPNLLTESEVAKWLQVSLACLRRWRFERRGPPYLKIGSLVRYRSDDVNIWVDSLPRGGSDLRNGPELRGDSVPAQHVSV